MSTIRTFPEFNIILFPEGLGRILAPTLISVFGKTDAIAST